MHRLITMHFLLLFFLTAAGGSYVQAQPKCMQVQGFTTENGLPQNSIKSMCADANGFLWIATEDGLARFDGTNFTVYKRDNTPAFTSNRIIQVGVIADSILYCANDVREIFVYRKDGSWFPAGKALPADWVLGTDNSLYYLKPIMAAKESRPLRDELNRDKPGRQTYLPVAGNAHGYLSVNKKLLCYVSNNRIKWYADMPGYNVHLNHAIGIVNSHVYYIDSALRLIRIDTTGKREVVRKVTEVRVPDSKYTKGNLSLNQDGQELFLQKDSVLYQLQEEHGAVLLRPVLSLVGIGNIFCYHRFGQAGVSAIGSLTDGLYLFRPKPFEALTLPGDAAHVFYAAVPMPGGGIFTHVGVLENHRQLPAGLDHIEPFSILCDRNRHYWIDVRGEQIVELDSNLSQLKTIRSKPTAAHCIRQTPDGRIWLSNTEREMGFVEQDSIHWLPNLHLPATTNIFTFLPLSDSLFLVGGRGLLFLLHSSTGRQEPLWNNAQRQARYLYKDAKGIIWIGTYGDGLFAWDGKKVTSLNEDIMHGSNSVHALLEDHRGFFWISSNNGLYQVKADELRAAVYNPKLQPYCYYYDQSNGFLTNEFNGACNPSGSFLADGRLIFPSMHGIVAFQPDSIHPLLPSYGIFIDQIFADGRAISTAAPVSFPAHSEYIEIRISAPFFGPSGNQQLQYQLAGADNQWYPVPEGGKIIFNRLRHGDYTLRLRKQTGFEKGDFTYRELTFSVRPAFRETWLFKLLLLATVAGLVIGFFRSRYHYLRRQSMRLQQEVDEHTGDQQRLITALKESDRIKEKIMQVITHDMQSQLHFVSLLSSRLVDNLEQEDDLKPAIDSARNLKKATAEIQRFTENFSVWTAAYIDGFKLRITTFVMQQLADDLARFFGDIVGQKQNKLLFHFSEDLQLYTDRHLLLVILRNLIDNANKHTRQGTIQVHVLEEEGWVTICVHDTGAGMDMEQVERLQQLIASAGKEEAQFTGSRIGYRLIADFVAGIGARIHLHSRQGEGTTVMITQIRKGNAL